MLAAIYGLWLTWKRRASTEARSLAESVALLLWVPLPFYIYSVAYGSVPIFIPQLWPHSYYNARYGMEMLPALSLYAVLAAERLDVWLRTKTEGKLRTSAQLWQPVALLLCAVNCAVMVYRIPPVLKEGIVNATTRVPFEKQLAIVIEELPPDVPIMMSTSAHIGIVQVAGRTLRSMVSENDNDSWQAALADPAGKADYIFAMEGDPVEAAVKAHPQGLTELEVICTTGQPCTKVYHSTVWSAGTK
jgi:hypothetical protein